MKQPSTISAQTSLGEPSACGVLLTGATGFVGAELLVRYLELRSYFDRLVEFALACDWGRQPISRATATATATSVETVEPSVARRPVTIRPVPARLALAQ